MENSISALPSNIHVSLSTYPVSQCVYYQYRITRYFPLSVSFSHIGISPIISEKYFYFISLPICSVIFTPHIFSSFLICYLLLSSRVSFCQRSFILSQKWVQFLDKTLSLQQMRTSYIHKAIPGKDTVIEAIRSWVFPPAYIYLITQGKSL